MSCTSCGSQNRCACVRPKPKPYCPRPTVQPETYCVELFRDYEVDGTMIRSDMNKRVNVEVSQRELNAIVGCGAGRPCGDTRSDCQPGPRGPRGFDGPPGEKATFCEGIAMEGDDLIDAFGNAIPVGSQYVKTNDCKYFCFEKDTVFMPGVVQPGETIMDAWGAMIIPGSQYIVNKFGQYVCVTKPVGGTGVDTDTNFTTGTVAVGEVITDAWGALIPAGNQYIVNANNEYVCVTKPASLTEQDVIDIYDKCIAETAALKAAQTP